MMARRILAVLLISVGFAVTLPAQFKPKDAEQPRVSELFIRPISSSEWFGFFNPENFQMHHSYSMSYATSGSQGLALGVYTNSMLYKFSEKVDARVDISLQHSPYSTFDSRIQNTLNGVRLSRAELNYRPWENTWLRISYQQVPFYYGYGSSFGSMFYGLDRFEGN